MDGNFFQSPLSNSLVTSFACGTNGEEEVESDSRTAAESSGFDGKTSQSACMYDSLDGISGYTVLREITQPSGRQLGLCIRLCPDEPVHFDESADKAMDMWRAECLVSKWSAIAPLSVSDAGCIGGVIKNTFVHVAPPPAAMQEHGARRRSRSLPKDLGSAKSIWDATRHAFKYAAGSRLVQQSASWAEMSEAASEVDSQERTVACESDAAPYDGTPEAGSQSRQEWWRRGSGLTWQRRGAQWEEGSSMHAACKGARKDENWWQESRSSQDWRTGSYGAAKEGWQGDSWWSHRSGHSNAWQKWGGNGKTMKSSSGGWWANRDRAQW